MKSKNGIVISRNRFPKWLTQKIGEDRDDTITVPIRGLEYYLDHFQTRKVDRTIVYISQPYQIMSYNKMKFLIELCDKHGIEFDIRPDSDHVPGRTIMIEWKKKEQ